MKTLVLSQKIERDNLLSGDYVLRKDLEVSRESIKDNQIKVIVGPRRAGKSVFALEMLRGYDFAYLNFDDERLLGVSDYDDLIKAVRQVYGETKLILFDEIQNLRNWELFVNRLNRSGFNIVITGSNSRLLSRELATHLTGRFIQFQIFPFSFSEFLQAKGFIIDETLELKERQGLILKQLGDYLTSGGYPEVVVKGLEYGSYISTLFESVLFKDIVKRYNIRYPKKLYDLAIFLITHHSALFSYTKLKDLLGFRSVHTVENYVEYLSEAFLIFNIERFSHKLREQLKSPRKVYTYDPGVIHAVKFRIAPDTGRVMENAAAIELLRRGMDIYYYKTATGKEVDIAVKEGLKIEQLIQVCYDIDNHLTKTREIGGLMKASEESGCKNLMILTWDHEGKEHVGTRIITFVPMWKWLIQA